MYQNQSKRYFLMTFLVLFLTSAIYSQSINPMLLGVVTGNGGISNLSIYWSVGELSVNTIGQSAGQKITQGFWQPNVALFVETDEPLQREYLLQIFPNPTNDWVQLALSPELRVAFTVFNLEGKEIYCETNVGNGFEWSLEDFSAGCYLIYFSTMDGKWIQTQKIIKQ